MQLPGDSAVIHAPGGGLGHLTRALNLSRSLKRAIILHQAPVAPAAAPGPGIELIAIDGRWTIAALSQLLVSLGARAPLLIVDTFPAGVAGEIDGRVLAAFRHRVLLRRHLRPGSYPDHDELAARFDQVLLPYPAGDCEWDGQVPGEHVGHLVRDLPTAPGPAHDLVVIGTPVALPPTWSAVLPRDTCWASGPLRRLPRAHRYLALGAGYNLTYELLHAGVERAAVPIERRYDDQYGRAERAGIGLYHLRDLRDWLAGAREPRRRECRPST